MSVSEAVIKEFLDAQLPFELEAGSFKVRLAQAEAVFKGSPAVNLTGAIAPTDHPDLVGEVRAQGALEDIKVDPESGTLRATVAIDHVDLVKMAGLEKFIGEGSLDELARTVRKQLEGHVPEVQIPVKIEQGIELPSITDGPVLIQGARMPLEVAVADVFAGGGLPLGGGEGRARRAGQDRGAARRGRVEGSGEPETRRLGGEADEGRCQVRTLLRSGTGLALALLLSSLLAGCGREDAATPEEMQAKLQALDQEIPALRAKLGEAVAKDRRLQGMPQDGVRVGVPTTLARTLIQRVVAGFVDSVTLRLSNIGVHKGGKIKKVVTIGEYDLNVKIKEVTGRLKTGKPEVTFGGNTVSLALPVQVASGSGTANIDFVWDGKNVSGAVCGDMKVNENVGGSVKPSQYPVSGALLLTTTTQQILASPKFPVIKVNLKVEPSPESWAVVQGILDSKGGVCGFVVDKVDIKGVLEGLLGKGFDVRLPTEKLKPMAVPVGIAPTMTVRDEPIRIEVKVGHLAITEHMIWLGADVALAGSPGGASTAERPRPRSAPGGRMPCLRMRERRVLGLMPRRAAAPASPSSRQ